MTIKLSADLRPSVGLLASRTRQNRTAFVSVLSVLTALFILLSIWRYGIVDGDAPRVSGTLTDLMRLLFGAGFLTLAALWGLGLWQWRVNLREHLPGSLSVEHLYELSPREFEQHVAGLFRSRGYRVEMRGRSGDLGVDLALTQDNGRRAIVQCKRYRHPIGPDIVRELFGTMLHERALHGFLVTTAEISDAARIWAADKPITLIDGRTLAELSAENR